MSSILKVGFIGTGSIAGTQAKHLKGIPGVEIVAAADVNSASTEAFKKAHGAQRVYTDYQEMLKQESLDAVTVCTPNFLHHQPALDALRAGAHVMVEKPMAMNAVQCQDMVAAAKVAKRQLVVGFQQRFSPNAQFMRQQVSTGVLGDVLFARVQAMRRRGIPNWGVFGRKDLQGGGALVDVGVHMLEMAHFIAGRPRPVAASASTYTYIGNQPTAARCKWANWDHSTYTVEDLAVGFVRFDNGMTMSIESSFAAHIDKNISNIQFFGSKGGLTLEPLQLYHDYNGFMMNTAPSFVGTEDAFEEKMRHFVAVARDGAPNESSGGDGLMVQQIMDALYASAVSRREVTIDAEVAP